MTAADLATLITAIVGLVGALGAGLKWLWDKVDARFKEVERKLDACEAREALHKDTAAAHLIVIELLWQEVRRRSRGAANDVLERAENILDALKEKQQRKDDK